MTGRNQKYLPLTLGAYSNELPVSLRKIHGLFLILIHLALAFTYILNFYLLNNLPLESSIQQFLFHNFGVDSMFLFLIALQISSSEFSAVSLVNALQHAGNS